MKQTASRLAATTVALLHFVFIAFVLFGAVLALKWPELMWLHLPAATWGVLIELFGWYCPLTKWENALLRQAGLPGYSGGFVGHYIMPVIYPAGLTRGLEVAIGLSVLALNISLYMKVLT